MKISHPPALGRLTDRKAIARLRRGADRVPAVLGIGISAADRAANPINDQRGFPRIRAAAAAG